MSTVRLDVFSDYVCPFCWLAEPAVRELVQSAPEVEIVRRAFELRPDPVPALDPKGDYLKRVWGSSVYPLAEKLGMTMKLAFFERGEDIGDSGVLVSLATGLGLDGESLREALVGRQLEQHVLADEQDAGALGLTGVPAFVANRKAALTGVQPVKNLRQLIDHVR